MASDVGKAFQQGTQYERDKMLGGKMDWANQPSAIKRYPDAPLVKLDSPRLKGGSALWSVLFERRSMRRYTPEPLAKRQLSQIVWAAQGMTATHGDMAFRTAPSAGALYPIETYLAIHNVTGIEPGMYHYALTEHALEQLKTGDMRVPVARAALDQRIAHDASVVFLWSAVFGRSEWKYKQRAYRYVYLDAGHIAQNVALGAVALGLGSCQIAALYDTEANALLGLDGEQESVIYMTTVGNAPR